MYIVIVMALIQLAGATHLSWLNTEIFRECYSEGQPHDDFVKITFRNCQIVCQFLWPCMTEMLIHHLQLTQKGNYKEAFTRMNKIDPEKLRAFSYNNTWTFLSGLLQLRRQICR